MNFNNILHRVARVAKNMDHSKAGVSKTDIPFVELKQYLNEIPLAQLGTATSVLLELAESYPAKTQQVFVTLAETMKNVFDQRKPRRVNDK